MRTLRENFYKIPQILKTRKKKNNFIARWYKLEDERSIQMSEDMKVKIGKYTQKFYDGNMGMNGGINGMGMNGMNMNQNMNQNPNNMNNFNNGMNGMNNRMNPNMNMNNYNNQNNYNNMNNNMNNNFNNPYNSPYYMNNNMNNNFNNNNNNNNSMSQNSSQMMGGDFSPLTKGKNGGGNFNLNRKNSGTSNTFNDGGSQNGDDRKSNASNRDSNNGKYTCRFEIQIENDKEFQVARRLIGAKGCNMKKIVEMCSKNQDGTSIQDAVKLRLRGKGSGYKEGPFNKESDEPLHLCISSKFMDRYKVACQLVNELVSTVYEEYKKYCEKTNKTAVPFLAVRKEEGISTRKSNLKSEFDL